MLDIIISRTMLRPIASRKVSLSGLVLQAGTPITALQVDHLKSIAQIPRLPTQEAGPALTQMMAAVVSACVAPLLPSELKQRLNTISMDWVKARNYSRL